MTLDTTVLQNALDTASADIDGHLGIRYEVPITTSGNTDATNHLLGMVYRLAAWYLWESNPILTEIPERVMSGYDHVMDWLRDVVAGKAVVASAVELTATTAQGEIADYNADDRVFGLDNLSNLI